MKPAFLACLFFFTLHVSAQNPNDPDGLQKVLADNDVIIENIKTSAYLNGTRLDSVDVPYATLYFQNKILYFDDGLHPDKYLDRVLTNKEGKKILIRSGSLAAALNLIYFNGWEVAEHYRSSDDNLSYFLLKKKKVAVVVRP